MNRRQSFKRALVCLLVAIVGGYGIAYSTGFEEGDIYIVTNTSGANICHVIKLDPVTGATTTLHVFPVLADHYATYDPFRDMILVPIQYGDHYLKGVRADGSIVNVGPSAYTYFTPGPLTARGDGKVYYIDNFGLQYLDASNAKHAVSGVNIPEMFRLQNVAHILYDPGTNAIFLACPSAAHGLTFCSGLIGRSMVLKIPLNGAGTAVSGAVTCVERNVSYVNAEGPVDISRGPNGSIFVVVSTNTNDREPRMLTLDPESMNQLVVFAQNGPYTGAAALNAGLYSERIGKAIVTSWGTRPVRTFAQGEVGTGTLLQSTSTGTVCTLVDIWGKYDPTCPSPLCGPVPPGFVWDRSEDWQLGLSDPVNPALDQNGCPVWSYEWTTGGPLNSGDPWYKNQTTQSVYDPSWFGGSAQMWVRQDDKSPPISSGALTHTLAPTWNWPYIPVLRWKNCTEGVEDVIVNGELIVRWSGQGGVGSPNDVDVVLARVDAATGMTTELIATTVSKPNPGETVNDMLAIPVMLNVAVNPGDQLIVTHRARQSMSGRWIALHDRITITNGGPQVGMVSGHVTGACGGVETGLFGVLVDAYEFGTGTLAGCDTTDSHGLYNIPDLPAGDYDVVITTPLGYTVASSEVGATVTGGATSVVDFALGCVPATGDVCATGFWKHQVGVATGGKGQAQIDGATLCTYLDLVEAHFNSNTLNEVVVYEPPASSVCDDKLLVAKDLLNLKGNVGKTARSKQHFMALLLNVASGRLGLAELASADSATVSQAVTYCDMLLDDADVTNDDLVKSICGQLNDGLTIATGVIPLTIDDIAYSPPAPESTPVPGFGVERISPNPFNPATTITYSIDEASHVRLTVYDVAGRLVRTLVDARVETGTRSVTWQATDNGGHPVASGIYFVRLVANGKRDTKKLVLLK